MNETPTLTEANHSYRFAEDTWSDLQRYTAFVGESKDDLHVDCEEIDVDAPNVERAREVTEAAMKRDYDSGMVIVHLSGPRIGMYM